MPGTTKDIRPITVPEPQPSKRPLSRTSLGSRGTTPVIGHTTGVKLTRSSSVHQGEDDESSQNVLITQGNEREDYDVPQHIEINAADWTADDDDDEDYGHTSHDGDDYHDVDITVDNGYDTDLEFDDEEFIAGPAEFDPSGIKDYIRECNRLGVIPCAYFKRHVHDANFCMRNHGLGPLGAKAIAKPLEGNTSIEIVDLEGNCIEAAGAKYLARMMKDNTYITELVLSENNLCSLGAQSLCNMLSENSTVRKLDLSGNNFNDPDGDFFLKLLEQNSTIRELRLAHNHFDVNAAKALKEALSVNESLRVLDLSWNHFRLKGACLLAEGIKENYGLKELYLSMNGFAKEGAKAMGQALKQNQCLEKLDLSSNRITSEGALDIGRALQTNSDLKLLKIGGNPISHVGAMTLLTAISKNENTEMDFLHMQGVMVDDNFEDLHTKMMEVRTLRVLHGGVMSKKYRIKIGGGSKWKLSDQERYHHLLTKLRKYIDDSGFRLVDLFKQFDKDSSWNIDIKEFRTGIKTSGIDMTTDEVAFLAARLDKDGDGVIDYGELVYADNKQREHKRLMEKQEQERGPDEDDTESVASMEAMLNALDIEEPDLPSTT